IVTNDNGCTEQSLLVTITGTEDQSEDKMGIRYTSLSQNGIQFLFDRSVNAHVSVFDVSGRIVHEEKATYEASHWNKISISGGTDGYYFLYFSIDERQYSYKIFLKF